MKTLFLALTFLFSFLFFSQKLIIHVFERQEMVSFSKTSIDSVISNPDIVYDVDHSYTIFNIDLDNEISSYFVDGVISNELPINCVNLGDGVFKINILQDGLDYGLIINTNIKNESVTWFWFEGDMTTVKVISKFNIEKPS